MIWLRSVRRRGAHGKNFKNLISVYNFNAQQAKVSGVFYYYFEVKFSETLFLYSIYLNVAIAHKGT